MMAQNKNDRMFLKYILGLVLIVFIIVMHASVTIAQWPPYSGSFPGLRPQSFYIPVSEYDFIPPELFEDLYSINFGNFSNWIWTDPFTAYNPNQNQVAFVNPGPGWQSPYFQQTGYNPDSFNQSYNYGYGSSIGPGYPGYGSGYGYYTGGGGPYWIWGSNPNPPPFGGGYYTGGGGPYWIWGPNPNPPPFGGGYYTGGGFLGVGDLPPIL